MRVFRLTIETSLETSELSDDRQSRQVEEFVYETDEMENKAKHPIK